VNSLGLKTTWNIRVGGDKGKKSMANGHLLPQFPTLSVGNNALKEGGGEQSVLGEKERQKTSSSTEVWGGGIGVWYDLGERVVHIYTRGGRTHTAEKGGICVRGHVSK